MKSCVVGIGAMGLEMALHIQNKGMDVVGVDLDKKQIAEAKKRGLSASEDLASQVSDIDVFIVIVATDKQTESVVETVLNNSPKNGAAVVIAGPIPDAEPLGHVATGLIEGQVLKMFLLVADDDVGDVGLREGVLGDGQQAVGVGR